MSGIEMTFEIGHSCGDQNTNDFLLLSAKHENKSEVVPGAKGQLRPIFLPKPAEFCIYLKCQKF